MTDVLVSALKVISMIIADQTNRYDPSDVKGTKLKRLKLGHLEKVEEEDDGENLDKRLVKEAREAIGYLQLDLPMTQLPKNLESEVVLVEHENIAKNIDLN